MSKVMKKSIWISFCSTLIMLSLCLFIISNGLAKFLAPAWLLGLFFTVSIILDKIPVLSKYNITKIIIKGLCVILATILLNNL